MKIIPSDFMRDITNTFKFNYFFILILLLTIPILSLSPNKAQAAEGWTEQISSNVNYFKFMVSSDDGTKLAAISGNDSCISGCFVYTSIDSGETWIKRTIVSDLILTNITTSSDGLKLAVTSDNSTGLSSGYIYTSSDGGITWSERTNAGTRAWKAIASSSDGVYLSAVANNHGNSNSYIYTSTDSGVTWTERTSIGSHTWGNIASSSDGSKLVVTDFDEGGSGGYVYTSVDSGATWTAQTAAGLHIWTSLSTSSSGDIIYLTDYNSVYKSTDSGETWTINNDDFYNLGLKIITSSADGSKLAVTNSNHVLSVSIDSGTTWTQQKTNNVTNIYYTLVVSPNGNKIIANGDNGLVYTFGEVSIPLVSNVSVSASSLGIVTFNGYSKTDVITHGFEYGLTTGYGTTITNTVEAPDTIFPFGTFTMNSIQKLKINKVYHYRSFAINSAGTGYGPDSIFIITPLSIQSNTSPHEWKSIATSADGSKLAAVVGGLGCSRDPNPTDCYIYLSTDSGVSWIENSGLGRHNWTSIVSSSDGSKLALVNDDGPGIGGYIYTSTDSGETWIENSTLGLQKWTSIASSADGTKLAAAFVGGYIYTSKDSGETWISQTNSGIKNWVSITSSSDGSKLAAVDSSGYIYTSTDSGETWIENNSLGLKGWQKITSSSDGSKLAAIVYDGYIYTSTDSGETWTERSNAGLRGWQSIASSSDGIKLIAIDNNGYIYISENEGIDWYQQIGSTEYLSWKDVVLSYDGKKIAAVVDGGGIYIYSSIDEIISFDEIPIVLGGTVGNATYADVESLISVLPTSVSAMTETTSIIIPVTTWIDTDSYNPSTAGSYTFTATLGSIPVGFLNSGNYKATVEVIMLPIGAGTGKIPKRSGGGGSSTSIQFDGLKLTPIDAPAGGPESVILTPAVYSTTIEKVISVTNFKTINNRNLKINLKGSDVLALQNYLNNLKYDCGIADGIFGSKTKAAVILFQSANNLTADGIVGPITKALIK